ncbi:MAG: ribosome-associated translation inhibitor RaiA [Alphaproteobacteria bacterium]
MEIAVKGKQLHVGSALRDHVHRRLSAGVGKYFDNAIEAQVVLSREARLFRCDISVHVGKGIQMQSRAELEEIYASFDAAADRVEKQLRRHKRRLRDHHQG